MMKTGKPGLQAAKASGSSVDSSLAYPNASLVVPPCPPSSQSKSKLNRFKITASILKQCSSIASPRPPEASNGLPNGLLSLVSDESSSEGPSQRRSYPKDIADFGLFQKRHWGSKEPASGAGELGRGMYSLSEEAGESGGSDAEEQDKEHASTGKGEKELLEVRDEEEAADSKDESSTNDILDEGGEKETEEGDGDLLCTDSVADGCLSASSREDPFCDDS